MDVKQSGSAGSTKIDCDNCPGKSLLGGGAISLSHVYKRGSSTLVGGVVTSQYCTQLSLGNGTPLLKVTLLET